MKYHTCLSCLGRYQRMCHDIRCVLKSMPGVNDPPDPTMYAAFLGREQIAEAQTMARDYARYTYGSSAEIADHVWRAFCFFGVIWTDDDRKAIEAAAIRGINQARHEAAERTAP